MFALAENIKYEIVDNLQKLSCVSKMLLTNELKSRV